MPPPVCIKFYFQRPLSLVVIFSYAPPLIFQTAPPPLQVIIAQSLMANLIVRALTKWMKDLWLIDLSWDWPSDWMIYGWLTDSLIDFGFTE